MLFTLVASLGIGLLAFWLITQNLNRITRTAKQFQEGNLQARISVNSSDELAVLAHTFNAMADTLVRNLEELKTEEKLRRELIANVSHDLRTPITAVHGYAETMILKKKNLTDADRDRYITIIFQSTEKLRKLVDQLFELSKLEALESKPNKEPFNLAELIREIYHQYLILAQQKNLTMNCLHCEGSVLVRADIGMMERVHQNLIDNAIKYTPAGGSVSISLSTKGNVAEIAVSNSGPGILPLHLPHIFERFHFKPGAGPTPPPAGMGLGLVIVKRILDLHGFSIEVQTEPDGPTRFCFQVPLVNESSG
ncbi:N/A [soil metagenome]